MGDKRKLKVFFLANIPVKGVPASFGGATVLAEEILEYIRSDVRLEVNVHPIRRTWKPKLHIIDHILWVFKFPFTIRKMDVISIHATWDFTFMTAPLVWIWAKLMGKKIVYHFFGGNFHKQYGALPTFLKFIYNHTLLKSDTVFFETKELVQYFSKRGIVDAIWLPNARKSSDLYIHEKTFLKRFVFISRVIPEKGIQEILEAAEKLSADYTVDLYGPIDERYLHEDRFKYTKVNYKGVLRPEEVMGVLNQYDVLLLPTWFKYEGYPGIVLEALSIGIPVISTYWNSIPEIIDDGYNGLLVPIKNAQQLYEAMMHFNDENYKNFHKNAFNSFEMFDSEVIFQKIVKSYF